MMVPAIRSAHYRRGFVAAAAICALTLGLSAPVLAQDDPEDSISQAVVQPIPNADTMQLNAALARLGRNPRDVGALIEAGRAAMAIGDVDAAVGFFRRAGQLSPGDGQVKAGLAGAMVRNGDPFGAIPLFAEAEATGAGGADMASDRGLAYDLVGDNARAQTYYRRAMALAPTDETLRRLSVSLAITGDRRAADGALAPLLARQDKAAQRTRAFVYAILGQQEEAVAIANTTMPLELASAMAPYLRYMRTLTKPQQAAAANLGVFPRASEIGRDDPRMAAFAPPKPVVLAAAPVAETGRNARSRRGAQQTRIARAEQPGERRPGSLLAPAPAAPVRQVAAPVRVAAAPRPAPVAPPEPQVARDVELPPIDAAPPPRTEPAFSAPPRVFAAAPAPVPVAARPEPVRIAQAPAVQVATPAPAPKPASASPGFASLGQGEAARQVAAFDLAPAVAPSTPAPAPAPAPAPTPVVVAQAPVVPQPSRVVSLAEAFSDIAAPTRDIAPVPGAVDIRRIQPVRDGAAVRAAAAAEAAKPASGKNARTPAPPSHPSRIWVQIATGRDKAALGFDWRRLNRQAASTFRDKRGHVSAWGQTNRLLTGPFESAAAANAFIAQLRRADIDGAFVWTSPAGQVVDALSGK